MKIQDKTRVTITFMCVLAIGFVITSSHMAIPNATAQQQNQPTTNWKHAEKGYHKPTMSNISPQNIVDTIEIDSPNCTYLATVNIPCAGQDTTFESFSYKTPFNQLIPEDCPNYTCSDTNYYNQYPSQITDPGTGFVYTFSEAENTACAVSLGICSSTEPWSSSSPAIITEDFIPTNTEIRYVTVYYYVRGSDTVEVDFVNDMTAGYSPD
ncbi:MAG TPA: hypothetical protein VFX64_00365 [Candidatus Nitrosotalea sp.]|nr:hypothetical protein [Candidatus Nitrosotalea sp.]